MTWYDVLKQDWQNKKGRMSVPITLKTLEDKAMQTAEVKQVTSEDEEEPRTVKNRPHWMMSMYMVTHWPTRVVQASMPI